MSINHRRTRLIYKPVLTKHTEGDWIVIYIVDMAFTSKHFTNKIEAEEFLHFSY